MMKKFIRPAIVAASMLLMAFHTYAFGLKELHEMSNKMELQDFIAEALRHDSLLKHTSTSDWLHELRISTADSLTMSCMPTLYDVVVNACVGMLEKEKADSLRREWVAFHKDDADKLALAYAYRSFPVHEHLKLYRMLPDGWERGLLLTKHLGSDNDRVVLPLLDAYAAKYADSPVGDAVLARRDERLQMTVSSRMSNRFTTTDSLRITFSTQNARKVVFRLCEYQKKGKPLVFPVEELPVLDSVEVTISAPDRPFCRYGLTAAFAPQKPGCYQVYAVLPEDTLSSKTRTIKDCLYFEVSDLLIFEYTEPSSAKTRGKCHVVATDALSGLPLRGAQVKGHYSYGWNALPMSAYRLTNKQGHALIRTMDYTWLRISAKRRGHPTAFDNIRIDMSHPHRSLDIFPNATIFRPGDTLRLTAISSVYDQDERHVNDSIKIKWSLKESSRWKTLKDSSLYTDCFGAASLEIPITKDMRLGEYTLCLNAKNRYSTFFFKVEEYRLPTFSLRLHQENMKLQLSDSAMCVRGTAMYMSGLPMSGQRVTATITAGQDFLNPDCVTDMDGTFRLTIPDSVRAKLKKDDVLTVGVEMTNADGETHEDWQYIRFAEPHAEPYTKPSTADLWPTDKQIWVPKDSLIYGQDDSVSVLIGLRSEGPVYVVAADKKQLKVQEWKMLGEGLQRLRFALPDDADNYLDIRIIMVRNGQVHTENVRAEVPLHKELHLAMQSFRDYLIPGAEEEWVMQLLDQDGKPAEGRFLFTMIDDAVCRLSPVNNYYRRLSGPWSDAYTEYSSPKNHTAFLTTKSILPHRSGFELDRLPLSEPYRAPGDTSMALQVTGEVLSETGEPIIGASVQVEGTRNGTITDYDGHFQIMATEHSTIRFSYIGMSDLSMQASPRMRVVLQKCNDVLNEVFGTGYGQPGTNSNAVLIRGVGSISTHDSGMAEVLTGEVAGVAVTKQTMAYFAEDEIEIMADAEAPVPAPQFEQVVMREGDTRLAFFVPGIDSDSAGVIRYRFRAPLDNTRWQLCGLAWDKSARSCTIDTLLTVRRTLMAHLTVPRFVRQGDSIYLPALIRNTAKELQKVSIELTLRSADTDSVLFSTVVADCTIAPEEEHREDIPCRVPIDATVLVASVKVIGNDGSSDGEQRLLKVLPIAEPVVESLPFYMHPADTSLTLRIPALPEGATDAHLVLSYCANPLAYVFDGLPAAVDTSFVTPIPMAHHLFTLAVGNRLAEQYPDYHEQVELTALIKALKKFQRVNGGFSWLADSRSWESPRLTEEFVYLMGELSTLTPLPEQLKRMTERAVGYLDRTYSERIQAAEASAKKSKRIVNYADYSIYAWLRSYFQEMDFQADAQRCYALILNDIPNRSNLLEAPYQALCLQRAGHLDEARHLIDYLRKRAMITPELGMFFNNLPKYHRWFSTCEQQATYLRAFSAVDPREEEVEALRQWLLLNNQTTHWGRSSLSAYAASALLQTGDNWLAPAKGSKAGLELDTLPVTDSYSSERFSISNGQLRVHNDSSGHPAWGYVSVVYNTPVTSVQPYSQPAISLVRTYALVRDEKLLPLDDDTQLKKGDRIRVTLTLTTDREMDGVVVRDGKPAALEPVSPESRFVWQPMQDAVQKKATYWSGVLSYLQFLNEAVECYIEHLPKGKYAYSYECYVTTSGVSAAGLATSESELAPEFNAHTGADVFSVKYE